MVDINWKNVFYLRHSYKHERIFPLIFHWRFDTLLMNRGILNWGWRTGILTWPGVPGVWEGSRLGACQAPCVHKRRLEQTNKIKSTHRNAHSSEYSQQYVPNCRPTIVMYECMYVYANFFSGFAHACIVIRCFLETVIVIFQKVNTLHSFYPCKMNGISFMHPNFCESGSRLDICRRGE